MNDHMCIFGDRSDYRNNITLLNAHAAKRKSARRNCRGISRLPGKNKHRNRVKPSSDHTRDCVCSARSCCDTDSCNAVMDSGIAFCCNGTCLLMMIIYTVKSRLMTKSIIKMHCTASSDHKYICNSILNKQFCNIVGYLHSHSLALQCFVNYLCHIFNLLICHARINTNPECRCHNTISLL